MTNDDSEKNEGTPLEQALMGHYFNDFALAFVEVQEAATRVSDELTPQQRGDLALSALALSRTVKDWSIFRLPLPWRMPMLQLRLCAHALSFGRMLDRNLGCGKAFERLLRAAKRYRRKTL